MEESRRGDCQRGRARKPKMSGDGGWNLRNFLRTGIVVIRRNV